MTPRDSGPPFKGAWDAVSRMVKADGVGSLWKGTTVNVVRSIVATGVIMTVSMCVDA